MMMMMLVMNNLKLYEEFLNILAATTQERLYNDIPKNVLSDTEEFYVHYKPSSLLISFKPHTEQ